MNRIKKGVAIMVFLVFAFAAALPAVADPSAEAEETGQTTEANATEIASLVINMPAPVAGQAAPSKDVVTVLMPSSEGSLEVAPVSVTSIQWRSDAGASAQADENQTALIIEASGFPYTATVTLTANSGYKFASEVAITSKNGETVSSPVSTDGSTSLSVDITFNAASSPSTSIASVTIDLAKPAVGAVPPTSAELAAKDSEDSELSDAVGLKSIEWKDKDGKVPEKITSDGFPYTAVVTISAGSFYVFRAEESPTAVTCSAGSLTNTSVAPNEIVADITFHKEKVKIVSISVDFDPLPLDGGQIPTEADLSVKVGPEDVLENAADAVSQTLSWKDGKGHLVSGTFSFDGFPYTATLSITPKEGYEFSRNEEGVFNTGFSLSQSADAVATIGEIKSSNGALIVPISFKPDVILKTGIVEGGSLTYASQTDAGQTIIPNGGAVLPGTWITISARPTESGQVLKSVTIKDAAGKDVPHDPVRPYECRFMMPSSSVTVSATFGAPSAFTLTLRAGSGGNVGCTVDGTAAQASSSLRIREGQTVVITATPGGTNNNAGVAFVTSDDYRMGIDEINHGGKYGTWTFIMPNTNVTADVSFWYTDLNNIPLPSISGPSSVTTGSNVSLTISLPALLAGASAKITPQANTQGLEYITHTNGLSGRDTVVLLSGLTGNATYTYRVTGAAGSRVSVRLTQVEVVLEGFLGGTEPIRLGDAQWSAPVVSPVVPTNPVSPPAPSQPAATPTYYPTYSPPATATTSAPSASASASASPSSSPSAAPSSSPSAAPSGAPSTGPSTSASPAPPAADVLEPNPEAPLPSAGPGEPGEATQITIENNPSYEEGDPSSAASLVIGIPITPGNADNATEAGTTVGDIGDYIKLTEGAAGILRVYERDSDDTPVPSSAPIATGMVIVVVSSDGEVTASATIVVKGDVLGTGVMNISQLVRAASSINGERPLDGIYRQAGKLSGGLGDLNISDLVLMARLLASAVL